MAETRTILVTGGTGRQGGAVARRLRADGHRVRALVRDPGSPAGAEPVRGDMDDVRNGVSRHVFPAGEPVQLIALEDIAEFAALAFADPGRFAGRTLELAGDAPTPDEAFAEINAATGLGLRYVPLGASEAEALGPAVAEARRLWLAGHRWHADIEALRALHPGLRTFRGWLAEGGADLLRRALLDRGTPR